MFLSQATGESHPERGFITLELGEKELQNIAPAQEAHFNSPDNRATTWRLEKHQRGRAASCREKTSSQIKGGCLGGFVLFFIFEMISKSVTSPWVPSECP